VNTGRHNLLFLMDKLCRHVTGRIGIVLLLAGSCALWLGCTPQKRYQTLSFFFDGVPAPNAASSGKNGPNYGPQRPNSGRAPLAYQHKPFAEGNCAACHQQDKKIDVAHVMQGCIACHPKVLKEYPVMHEPLATGECLWCHLPHESNEQHLLISSSPKLCSQCHESSTLSPNPPEHMDSQRNCLDCHVGHGGADAQFLRHTPAATTLPSHGGAS